MTATASEAASIAGGAVSLGGSAVGLDASADFEGSVEVELDLGLTFDVATGVLDVVGRGMTGGIGVGSFQRLTSDGSAVLDRVDFNGIEAFEIIGTSATTTW